MKRKLRTEIGSSGYLANTLTKPPALREVRFETKKMNYENVIPIMSKFFPRKIYSKGSFK